MSAPDTAVPPTGLDRPHGLGDVLTVAWRTMRARYGLYVLITVLPALLSLVVAVLVVAAVGAVLVPVLTSGDPTTLPGPGVWIGIGLGSVVVNLAVTLVAVRAEAVRVVLTRHTMAGRRPRLGELWRETSGYLARILPLVLLGAAAGLVVSAVLGTIYGFSLATSLSSLRGGSGDSGGEGGPLPLVLSAVGWLVYALLYVVLIWVGVRLTPVTVVVALERRGGMPALRRAWRLTYGYFWRTLGYTLVGSLIPSVVVSLVATVSLLVVAVVLTATLADQFGRAGLDPAGLVGPVVLGSALGYLPTVVALVLVQPYYSCFLTTYSMDLARRQVVHEPVTSPEGGWQPRPYPSPTQWAGHPPSGRPPSGHPPATPPPPGPWPPGPPPAGPSSPGPSGPPPSRPGSP